MEEKLKLLLVVSIIFNVFFIFHNLFNKSTTWSSRAAIDAEAAASVQCSGHGRAYVDGVGVLDGLKPPCECNQCYTGTHCSQFLPNCSVDANRGDPLFLEPFWMNQAKSSAVVVSGWHRMSYMYQNDIFVSEELEKIIKKLHNVVGNTVTDNRFVIFGTGSTQLLAAAVHALSYTKPNSSSLLSPARLVTSVPYYTMYKEQAEFFNSVDLKFEGDASVWKNKHDNTTRVIEMITSPNNPDGELKKAILEGSNVKKIHDYAYYWPLYTPITEKADQDLSLFTLSKSTGHAGSRFGWALVKDKAVYESMQHYLTLSSIGVSKDTQLRALQILKVVVDNGGEELFKFGYETMKKRWETLKMIFSISTRFSVKEMKPEYCNYFKKVRLYSWKAYAWVKCERPEDENCYEVFKRGNIITRDGKVFGAGERFVRLSLIRAEDDFDLLIEKLKNLVASEEDMLNNLVYENQI